MWTKEECDHLIELKQQTNPKLTGDQIADRLGRSRKAVTEKYSKICYEMANGPTRRKPRKPRDPSKSQPAYERNDERWTEEENTDLVRRADAGESYQEIGRVLNRTGWACKAQYGILKRGGTARLNQIDLARQADREAREEAIRQARAAWQPQSITAWLLGDPRPGRSALDQKRAGSEP